MDAGEEAGIPELIERYFLSESAPGRAELAALIERATGDDFDAAVSAVRGLQLWEDLPQREGSLIAHPVGLDLFEVCYRLPGDYDPRQPTPLLVCLPGERASAGASLAAAQAVCGETVADFVLTSPEHSLYAGFHAGEINARVVHALLYAVRREVHIDSHRIFLLGCNEGADAAWMVALFEPDTFAGLIALGGYPQLPYPEQTYPWLLGNLRSLPTLTGPAPAGPTPSSPAHDTQVEAYLAVILELAQKAQLPIESWTAPAPDSRQIDTKLARFFAQRRNLGAQPVARWFRFPGQGDAGWLRQSKFRDEPWTADQFSVVTAPGTDFARYVTDTLRQKLAYLAGSLDGQHVTITASKCARIEILLGPEMIDFDQPLSITCNGQHRHPRRVTPSITTLLETAYEDWEFQDLVVARITLPIKSDAAGN